MRYERRWRLLFCSVELEHALIYPNCVRCGAPTQDSGCGWCTMSGRPLLRGQQVLDIRKAEVRESMVPLVHEHRLEPVGMKEGVVYVNDSKATNVNATWYALECMDRPVIWIAGGAGSNEAPIPLRDVARAKVRMLLVVGEWDSALLAYFRDLLPVALACQSMMEAVTSARVYAEPGDVVLLSPACATCDRYPNYEERGREFKRWVARL